MKGLITLIMILVMIGVVIGTASTWTYMHFFGQSAVYHAR